MRIVFLTNETFYSSEKFRYMFANVAASFPDVHVVAVRRSRAEQVPFLPRLQERAGKVLWRVRRFGFLHTLEVLTSRPLKLSSVSAIGGKHMKSCGNCAGLQQNCGPTR